MTHHDQDPVRELLEQAQEQRRREQPPPELFEAALGRLSLEERGMEERGRERRFSLSRALNVLQRSLFRLGGARLGLALALTLAVLVSWRARRPPTLEPHQDVPTVMPTIALAAEPTPLHDATRSRNLGDSTEHPSLEQRPAPSAARASGARRPRVGGPAMQRGIAPQQTEAVAGTEPATAVVPATETKKKPAPKGSPEKPGGKPAKPAQPNCDPPWYINADGIQRLKQNCL